MLEYPGGGNVPHRRGALAFWVRPDWSVRTAKATHVFFREAPPDQPGDDCRWIWYHASKSRLRFDLRDPRDSYVYADISGWRAGTWHFVVQTWDAATGVSAQYIDGRPFRGGSDRGKAFLHPPWTPRPKRFFWIGSRGGHDPAMAAFDEVTTYDRMLTAEQVRRLYASRVPLTLRVPRPYLAQQARVRIDFEVRNLQDVSVPGPLTVRLFAGDAAQPSRRWTLKSAEFAPRQLRRLTVEAEGLVPGDYRLEAVPPGASVLPGSAAFLRICFSEPPRASKPASRLVQETDLTRKLPESVFCDDGTSRVVRSGAGVFREAGEKKGSRFAVRLRVEKPGQWHRLEWTWPDDRPRTMDIIVNGCRYDVAGGILAGDEYPNSGRMQIRTVWFWPRRADDALVFMTAETGRPAAAGRVRLYEMSGPPAALDVPAAKFRGAPERQVGLYYEDPVLPANFGGAPEFPSFKAVVDRLTAYMDACGLNVLYYPAVWYHGPLYPSPSQGDGQLGSRPHPRDFIRYLLMRFEKHGFRLVTTFNVHDLPSLANCVTDAARVRAGASTPVTVQWDTSLKISGWHGTPGDFNPLAPEVHTAVGALVREIADRYGDSPAFGGICLHLPRHSLLWFGSTDTGYNDENLHGFEKDTGLRLGIDYASPVRANRAYRTLRSKYWEQWLDWRCGRLAGQWAEYAGILRERRPDLTLAVNLYTVLDETNADRPADQTDFVGAAREFGADVRLLARIPNIQFLNTFSPGLYRWHRSRRGPFRPEMRVFRTENFVSNAYRPFAELGRPFGVNLHDKYWEDPIGRLSPLEGLKKWGQRELGWRVSTPVPAEPYALENYAEAMGEADVTVLTKGGFVVGTAGMEAALGRWATAFRQLPAAPFADVPGLADPVRVRTCSRADGDWCSIQNRLPYPLRVSLSVIGGGPATDLAGRRELRPVNGRVDLRLAPYQLVALWGRPGTLRLSGGRTQGTEAVTAQLAPRLRRTLAARPESASVRARSRIALVERALTAGRLARAMHLLEGPWAARLEQAGE
ncbi:MAG: LamG domain-containing protein [Kiritimatiellaeota bacterium]|nr:LamG domain-containing protein [Kiritimatiellota bacterium]